MSKKRGIARGSFRMDGCRLWKNFDSIVGQIGKRGKPQKENFAVSKAAEARKQMIEKDEEKERAIQAPVKFAAAVAEQQKKGYTSGSLTDEVVNDYMGGKYAAAEQAKAYRDYIENVKAGRTTEPKGSLAAEARQRMIDRDEEGHPDIGRDKANRRAYPKK